MKKNLFIIIFIVFLFGCKEKENSYTFTALSTVKAAVKVQHNAEGYLVGEARFEGELLIVDNCLSLLLTQYPASFMDKRLYSLLIPEEYELKVLDVSLHLTNKADGKIKGTINSKVSAGGNMLPTTLGPKYTTDCSPPFINISAINNI